MKKYICILIFAIISLSSMTYAGEPSFYSPEETQEAVYNVLMNTTDFDSFLKEYNLLIVKNSIAPVYGTCLLDYAVTGNFDIEPLKSYDHVNEKVSEQSGNVYLAKIVFSENNTYAGSIVFSVEDGSAYLFWFNSSNEFDTAYNPMEVKGETRYLDYYDNADWFDSIFSSEDDYSVNNTRYVMITGYGDGFIIGTGDDAVYVFPKTSSDAEIKPTFFHVNKDFKEKAEKDLESFYEIRSQYREWLKEHPGEEWDVDGDCPYPLDYLDYLDETMNADDSETGMLTESTEGNDDELVAVDYMADNNKAAVKEVAVNDDRILSADVAVGNKGAEPGPSDNYMLYWIASIIGVTAIAIIGIVFYRKKQR